VAVRTALVVTNRRCNQNCSFCTERSATDERALVRRDAVEARIAAAVANGAEEIVLTGGEPTLRRDLTELVASAKRVGAARITLETNGAYLDRAAVDALLSAGVDTFRVHVPAWGDVLDDIVRDEGAFAAVAAALRAIAATTAELEVSTPIVRSNVRYLNELPAALVGIVGDARRIRAMRLVVPTRSPDDRELLSFDEIASALSGIDRAARSVGLATKLAPGNGPPPCIVPARTRPTQLWSLTGHAAERADRVRVPECNACLVRSACSGFDAAAIARFGVPTVTPIAEERVRRRLALITTVEDQIAREFITHDRARDPTNGQLVDEEIIRINFHCNQACSFCFVSTHLPPPSHQMVVAAIEAAIERGARVVLSGGEPTLNPRLHEYVRLGSRGGVLPLQLQTNAVRLDDAELVRVLVGAGLREAFVSLHGAEAKVSDAITGAAGTFARTLVGIDHLVRHGVRVVTNYVICESNAAQFPDYVDVVARRWPTSTINVSFVAPSTDVVPRDRELIPRLSDVLPALAEGARRAEAASVDVRGFESMCGVPLCIVPDTIRRHLTLAEVPEGVDRGEFIHVEACDRCSERARCFGVRRGYAELHGIDELRPIAAERCG
jgi:MoaA/NifB/PqqE/SkfB family radical SAM enzyme